MEERRTMAPHFCSHDQQPYTPKVFVFSLYLG
jgi:hypothetical protein